MLCYSLGFRPGSGSRWRSHWVNCFSSLGWCEIQLDISPSEHWKLHRTQYRWLWSFDLLVGGIRAGSNKQVNTLMAIFNKEFNQTLDGNGLRNTKGLWNYKSTKFERWSNFLLHTFSINHQEQVWKSTFPEWDQPPTAASPEELSNPAHCVPTTVYFHSSSLAVGIFRNSSSRLLQQLFFWPLEISQNNCIDGSWFSGLHFNFKQCIILWYLFSLGARLLLVQVKYCPKPVQLKTSLLLFSFRMC